jgi:hypothetical protein
MVTQRHRLRRPASDGRRQRPWNRVRKGPPRRCRTPELMTLERRELLTVVPKQFLILVSPAVLPPTGQSLPVTISGAIASTRPRTPIGFFHVTDEYRQYEPHGSLTLTPIGPHNGYYDFQFQLTLNFPAKRSTNTPDGRHFYVLIGVQDQDNTDGRTVGVFVPKTYPPPQYGKAVVTGPTVTTASGQPRR